MDQLERGLKCVFPLPGALGLRKNCLHYPIMPWSLLVFPSPPDCATSEEPFSGWISAAVCLGEPFYMYSLWHSSSRDLCRLTVAVISHSISRSCQEPNKTLVERIAFGLRKEKLHPGAKFKGVKNMFCLCSLSVNSADMWKSCSWRVFRNCC